MGQQVKKLPSSLELLYGLQCLNLSNCINLEFIPESICNLNSLKKLFISDCPKIVKFPHVSAGLRYMKELVMDNCSSLSEIHNDIGCLSSLERLSLRGSNIVSIPASIKLLTNLGVLDMSDSKRLQSLPELPPSLVYLVASDCGSLTTVSSPRTTISDSKYLKQYRHTVRMDFTNCLDLDLCAYGNVMTEAWLALKFCLDEMLNFEVILPGSEIPKWFPYQSNGPSFTIKWIPPTWGIGHSWGFVTCVVFDVKGRIPLNKLDHKCEIEGDHFFESFPLFESCTDRFFEKDHVIMMSSYWNREGYSLPRCCSDGHHNVTFTILPQNPDRDHDTCKVKKVGIYPIKKNHREATSELCCG
ncbi:TIR-NBS-LRR resistance protein [Quillaja saponaria]|uniref:TIR-NBS-LRR resistance protein n=1 Tax=Quillaja saponaria TaxID=32244 RepID=A0AAD7LQY7_QUISA|nr:TIR-NBS-LRR resistance protein [Quillaja saponaria]